MGINVRFVDEVAVLSNVGRLMNDPRHFDAVRAVRELLDGGTRRFILELSGVRETGPTVLGLLMTLVRQVKKGGGEAVLANISPPLEKFLEEMRMDAYWDLFDDAEEALAHFADQKKTSPPRPG